MCASDLWDMSEGGKFTSFPFSLWREMSMSKLTTKARNKLSASSFAGPDRSYPIEDKGHAAAAKARASEFASPALKAKVDRAADRVLGKGKKK
jgi:hypothetical protein